MVVNSTKENKVATMPSFLKKDGYRGYKKDDAYMFLEGKNG